jgi:hypothetical protein
VKRIRVRKAVSVNDLMDKFINIYGLGFDKVRRRFAMLGKLHNLSSTRL